MACSVEQETSQNQRINSLNKSLMCPVCPGESIDQSQNDLAAQMRNVVSQKVYEGKSDKEIKDYFTSKYGPVVLMEPPRTGIGVIAWIFPVILTFLMLIVVICTLLFLKKRSNKINKVQDVELTTNELNILTILKKENLSQNDISELLKNSEENQ